MTELDDTRGILTEADRSFLWKDADERAKEYSRSARSQRRTAIRSRLTTALYDLRVLYIHLPDRDRQQVFRSLEDEGIEVVPLTPVLTDGWALLALGILEKRGIDLDDESFYEGVLENTIESILFKKGRGAEQINVDVEIEGWTPPGDLAEVDPSELTESQLRHLLFENRISSEEFCRGIQADEDGVDDE